MLEEHKQIRAATEKLRDAARQEKATAHEQCAEELPLHAQSEEEVLYRSDSGRRHHPGAARGEVGTTMFDAAAARVA
jgi:hypothetical protein